MNKGGARSSRLAGPLGGVGAAPPQGPAGVDDDRCAGVVPRMFYLYGEQNMGLPEQWFTATVVIRDPRWCR